MVPGLTQTKLPMFIVTKDHVVQYNTVAHWLLLIALDNSSALWPSAIRYEFKVTIV